MAPANPARISRFEVLSRLGQGGMGAVYLATDPLLGRTVAIKVLLEFTPELRARFAREARSAAVLSHHNIVQVFDVGEDQGRPFIAMEYVDGETFSELIGRRAELSLERRLRLMIDLCGGLAYAHRQGLIHRDIKPANIMISTDGVVKILDFGLARLNTDSSQAGLTRVGMILGTPHYMSPEQVEGRTIDHRSDIFSVGLVLYELLAYRKAFPGDLHSVMYRIVHAEPPPLAELYPSIDPALARAVAKAIQKAPEHRYATLALLAEDLTQIIARLPQTDPDSTVQIEQREPRERAEGSARTPASGRPIPNVETFARRRAAQIQQHLALAEEHYRSANYQAAIEQCELAAVLDPEDNRVLDLLQRAYVAVEDQQVEGWLRDAADHLASGALMEANALIEQSLQHRPDLEAARQLRRTLDDRQREQDAARERTRALAAALDRGRASLNAGALQAALRASNEALACDPNNSQAKELKAQTGFALQERQREQEHEQHALEAATVAREHAVSGRYDEAFRLLDAFSPAHPLVEAARIEIVADHAAFEERQREEEARLNREAQEDKRRSDAERAARQVDEARRRELQGEQRRQEAELRRREALAAAWMISAREALQDGRFSEALAALEQAHAAIPSQPEVAHLRAEIAAGISRHEEAVRVAKEVAQCIERAARSLGSGDLSGALRTVDAALTLEPGNQDAAELRAEVTTLIEARNSQAEQRRRAQMAAAHARQQFARGEHEAAMRGLREFTPAALVAPVMEELERELGRLHRRQEQEARKAAERRDAERAQAESRRADDDALRTDTPGGLEALEQAARETSDQRQQTPDTPKRDTEEHDHRQALEQTPSVAEDLGRDEIADRQVPVAEEQRTGLSQVQDGSGAPVGRRRISGPLVAAAAAAALVVLTVAIWFLRAHAPVAPQAGRPESGRAAAATLAARAESEYAAGQVSRSITTALETLDQEPDHPAATRLLQRIRSDAAVAATTARDDAAVRHANEGEPYKNAMALLTRAGALTELRRTDEAVQLYTRAAAAFRTSIAASASDPESFLELAKRSGTDRTAAIQYAENGLKIDPEHRGLRNFLNGLRSDAEQTARQARIAAARGGASADRTASFSRAEDRLREGTRLSAPSQIRESLAAYADAQRLYSQALEEAASAQREGERIRGEVQAHIAQARRHIDAHDLPRAREELGQADRRMPGSPEVVALRRDITAAEALERETAIGGVLAQAKGISTPSERIKVLRQGLDRFPNEPRITQALAAATESLREPANPPPAPPTVRSIPVATVQRLLDAYFGAYQTLDFNALKAVFPNASDFDRRRLAALRDQFRSCAYERGEPTITPVSESQAFAEIVVKETCSPKIRAPQRPVTNTQTFRFEKRGADWVIRTGPG